MGNVSPQQKQRREELERKRKELYAKTVETYQFKKPQKKIQPQPFEDISESESIEGNMNEDRRIEEDFFDSDPTQPDSSRTDSIISDPIQNKQKQLKQQQQSDEFDEISIPKILTLEEIEMDKYKKLYHSI